MKPIYEMKKRGFKLLGLMWCLVLSVACSNNDIDNSYSRNFYEVAITTSSDYVVLDENKADEVALELTWTPSHDYGNDYIVSYTYQMELVDGAVDPIEEYEDANMFVRKYTHKELQELLVNTFGQLTSTRDSVKFTVTASTVGPRLVVPDIATAVVAVKTYGAKQFLADSVYLAVEGQEDIKLTATSTNTQQYIYSGEMSAGNKVYLVAYYGDEVNAICPATPDLEVTTTDPMDAIVVDRTEANTWVLPEDGAYRITLDFDTKTVKIVSLGEVLEIGNLYLAGSAVSSEEDVEVTQTLENESLYAFYGELQAGSLYLPIQYGDSRQYAIAPYLEGEQAIDDGVEMDLKQVNTEVAAGGRYWTIPEAGTYRIVVDAENKKITIYSADTDKTSKVVGPWNANATFGDSAHEEYTSSFKTLWMWGTFNGKGLNSKYVLTQSLANPHLYVYKGSNLPRQTTTDYFSKETVQASVMFFVGVTLEDGTEKSHNNAYAFGSTAAASRTNQTCGYVTATLGESLTLVEGQGDNRYAYFIIPQTTNYVEVDVENLTVVFDHK